MVEVVAFPGALADTGEYGQAGVLGGDIVDQLHHVDGLAHAGAAKQADLAAFRERTDQVDHLDASFQQFGGAGLLFVGGCGAVDGHSFLFADGAALVDGVAEYVHDAAQGLVAYRYGNRGAGVLHRQAAAHALGGAHGDGAHHAVAQLLLHFHGEVLFLTEECVVDIRYGIAREFHVDDRADHLHYLAVAHFTILKTIFFAFCHRFACKQAPTGECRVTPRRRRRRFRTAPG